MSIRCRGIHAAARLHRVAITKKGQNYELKINVVKFIISIHCLFFYLLFFLPTYLPFIYFALYSTFLNMLGSL